jgi:5-methylcytosine-specific restriction endonuclease McrA
MNETELLAVCETCDGGFVASRSTARFCSDLCRVKAHQAKTGRRNSLREEVLLRDDYRCKVCSERDKRLYVRRVDPKPWSGPRTVENCATLCSSCHARCSAQTFSRRTKWSLKRYRAYRYRLWRWVQYRRGGIA